MLVPIPRSPQSWTPKTVPGLTDRRRLGREHRLQPLAEEAQERTMRLVFRQMAKVWGAIAFGQHFGLVIRR